MESRCWKDGCGNISQVYVARVGKEGVEGYCYGCYTRLEERANLLRVNLSDKEWEARAREAFAPKGEED